MFKPRGTSTLMSIRSSTGPEIRFWYFVTGDGASVHAFIGSPKYVRGHTGGYKPHGPMILHPEPSRPHLRRRC
jgi:hypothetical protein